MENTARMSSPNERSPLPATEIEKSRFSPETRSTRPVVSLTQRTLTHSITCSTTQALSIAPRPILTPESFLAVFQSSGVGAFEVPANTAAEITSTGGGADALDDAEGAGEAPRRGSESRRTRPESARPAPR